MDDFKKDLEKWMKDPEFAKECSKFESVDGGFEIINVKEIIDEEMKDPEFAKEYRKLEIEELKFEIRSRGQKVEAMFESYLGERSKLMFMIDALERMEVETEKQNGKEKII